MGFVVRPGLVGETSRVISRREREAKEATEFGRVQEALVTGKIKPEVIDVRKKKKVTYVVTKPSGEVVERTTITTPVKEGKRIEVIEKPVVKRPEAPTRPKTIEELYLESRAVSVAPEARITKPITTPEGRVIGYEDPIRRMTLIAKEPEEVRRAETFYQRQLIPEKKPKPPSKIITTVTTVGEAIKAAPITPLPRAITVGAAITKFGVAEKKISETLTTVAETPMGKELAAIPGTAGQILTLYRREGTPTQIIEKAYKERVPEPTRQKISVALGAPTIMPVTTKQALVGAKEFVRGAELEVREKPLSTAALFGVGFAARPAVTGIKYGLTKATLAGIRKPALAAKVLKAGRVTGKAIGVGAVAAYTGLIGIKAAVSPEPIPRTLGREAVRIGAIVTGARAAGGVRFIRNLEQLPITHIRHIGKGVTTVYQRGRVRVDVARDTQFARVYAGGKLRQYKLISRAKGITRPDVGRKLLREDITRVKVQRIGVTGRKTGKIIEEYPGVIKGATTITPKGKVITGKGAIRVITRRGEELFTRKGTTEFLTMRGKSFDKTYSELMATKFKKIVLQPSKVTGKIVKPGYKEPPKIRIREDPTLLKKGQLGIAKPYTKEILLRQYLGRQQPAIIRHELTHIAERGIYAKGGGKPIKSFKELSKRELGAIKDFGKLYTKKYGEEVGFIKSKKETISILEQYPKKALLGEFKARIVEHFPGEVIKPTTYTGRVAREDILRLARQYVPPTKKVTKPGDIRDIGLPTGKIKGLKPFTTTLGVSKKVAEITTPTYKQFIFETKTAGVSTRRFQELLKETIPRGKVTPTIKGVLDKRGGVGVARVVPKPLRHVAPPSPMTISPPQVAKLVLPDVGAVSVSKLLPISIVGGVGVAKTVTEIRPMERVSTRSIGREITAPVEITAIEEVVGVEEAVEEVVGLREITGVKEITETIPGLRTITEPTPSVVTAPPSLITAPPPPPFEFPFLRIEKPRKKKVITKALPRMFRYQPGLTARALKIKGKKPGLLTGLGIRPIIKVKGLI